MFENKNCNKMSFDCSIFATNKKYFESFNLDKLEKNLEDINLVLNDAEKFVNCSDINFLEEIYLLEVIDHLPEKVRNSCLSYAETIENYFMDDDNYNNLDFINKRGINYLNFPDDLEGDFKDCSWLTSELIY